MSTKNSAAKRAANAEEKAGLRVRSCSPNGTFRRAGLAFSADPITLVVADLTEDQIDAIKGERMLVCEAVDLPAEPPADT